MKLQSLFGGARLQMDESIDMTLTSLLAYGPTHRHWAIAWSGGKDSTALLTLVMHLLDTGRVPRPETFTVLYADTRLELLPLYVSAGVIQHELRRRGVDVRTVMAPLDKRFLVYVLGRGVPPPNNNTLRWCTRQIKVDPMAAELRRLVGDRGEKVLMLTGVRQGESAIRDGRIAMSCGRDGAECGQGWYQETLPDQLCDTLAPLLHWRVCHVWDWLMFHAPAPEYGGWATSGVAEAYGGEEAEEINARTGCVGCPLAQRDTALDAVLAQPEWAHLAPLKEIRPVWRELRRPQRRLRQPGGEARADGSLSKNQQRLGPLTLDARRWALGQVLGIQRRVNEAARAEGRPPVDLLDAEEEARIRDLIEAGTWPQRWTGEEPRGDVPLDAVFADGSVQPLLPWDVEAAG
ncbi:MAG: phosphoadenosine phosphosulfate reductase family protein [Gemmatimonadales bacterium]|nr:phosphoadenosine phosphosulfate reductase family protein [Gemmatimonadales bacterium]